MPERYFELLDHHGRDAAGDHEPIIAYGLGILVPAKRGGEIVEEVRTISVQPATALGDLPARIIPDTRIIEVADPRVAQAIAQDRKLAEIEPLSEADLAQAREKTAAHRNRAATVEAPARSVRGKSAPAPAVTPAPAPAPAPAPETEKED